MLLYPCNLLESNDFIIDSTSLSVPRKEFILLLVLYKRGGNTHYFFIVVHRETKKLLKRFAFLQVIAVALFPNQVVAVALVLVIPRLLPEASMLPCYRRHKIQLF